MEKDYRLDKNKYYETIWFIRSYPTLKEEYEMLFWHSSHGDGMPRGTDVSDPTFTIANLCLKKAKQIAPIEESLPLIPEAYRKGIMDNIVYKKPYPNEFDSSTFKRWKRRFVYYVAMRREYDF